MCVLYVVCKHLGDKVFGRHVLATQVGLLGDALFEDRRMADCGKMWQWRGDVHPGLHFVGAILYDF